jgi:hypothetical protein
MSDYLPKKPTEVELKVMKEMFEASVDGEAYDMERFGQYFRPAGMSSKTGDPVINTNVKAETPKPIETATAKVEVKTESVAAPKAESKSRAEDILAMIRSRQKQ